MVSMRIIQWSLRTNVYRVLIVLCLFVPPAFCYAQVRLCYATGVTEVLSNMSTTWNAIMNYYVFNYTLTVTWNCSGGMTSYCTVCELDTMYKWDGTTYAWFDSFQTTDNAPVCSSTNNSETPRSTPPPI